ncbi:uncharacterized protein PAC_15165 [Phialocephala subalpina]|uniref:Protein kinase domain-containing protein n=1 Tax=Phialocephala subalpina TaxID=576137 RepID=A0A1L7XJN9_9HELO|nr:uncharacterized protein PAC_15165 [Phialocephala subalpina]
MSTNTFVLSRDQVYYTPGLEDSGGRSMGISKRGDGSQVDVLLEWRASVPADLGALVAKAVENIPTDEDVNRPEEVRTLKFEGLFKAKEPSLSALVYECPQKPLNLRDVLLTIAKPSGDDRGKLAAIIATQIRSLNVHFRLRHAGLRPESFIFFGLFSDPTKPNLSDPYLLDWGRPSSPNIYEHPEYQAGQSLWFHDIWSLMMILSEIAEWKPVDGTFRDANELSRKKLQRKQEVMDASWKGDRTAAVMQYGFKFLEKDRSTLQSLSRKDVKRFFDRLCSLLDGP